MLIKKNYSCYRKNANNFITNTEIYILIFENEHLAVINKYIHKINPLFKTCYVLHFTFGLKIKCKDNASRHINYLLISVQSY